MIIKYFHFSSIHSTNSWVKEHPHLITRNTLLAVSTDYQTSGRGQGKRLWFSPPCQNLLVSFAFLARKDTGSLFNSGQVFSLSACKMLESKGFHPQLKWPNDLLLSGKKVAGILTETVFTSEGVAVIAGIGMNINMTAEDLSSIDQPVTSLRMEQGKILEIPSLLHCLAAHVKKDLSLFFDEGFSPFLADYGARIVHKKGEAIAFRENENKREGTFHAINCDGSLNVRTKEGTLIKIYSGEL